MDAGYINILLQLHLLLITLRLNNLSLIKEDFVKLLLNSFFFFSICQFNISSDQSLSGNVRNLPRRLSKSRKKKKKVEKRKKWRSCYS